MFNRIGTVAALFVLAAGSARATLQVNSFDTALYGRWWHVTSYHVQDDLLAGPNDNTFLMPEGIAFRNNLLYVSGDAGQYYTDSRLARYQAPPGGILTYNGFVQITSQWGPDGLTFNDLAGYGSGANDIVTVEKDPAPGAGVVDLTSGNLSNVLAVSAADAVSAIATGGFAAVDDAGAAATLVFFDDGFAPTGVTFAVAPGTRGLAYVSPAFAEFLTGTPVADGAFVTLTRANPGNAINVYDLAGNAIGGQQDLPVEPRARIPIGGGFYITKPAFGGVEGIAVDEVGQVIYIADRDNSMVHVLTPGTWVGDLDNDGDVDLADLAILLANYGTTGGATYQDGDLDGDGDVDLGDLALMLANYGRS